MSHPNPTLGFNSRKSIPPNMQEYALGGPGYPPRFHSHFTSSSRRPQVAAMAPTEANTVSRKIDMLEKNEQAITQRLNEMQATRRSSDLNVYTAIQTVYAKAMTDLRGYTSIACDALSETAEVVVKKGETCQLVYPMKLTEHTDGSKSYFMRCKTVHPVRGDLSIHWVRILHESEDKNAKKVRRYIGKFTVVPK